MQYFNLSGNSSPSYYDGDWLGWVSVFVPSVLMCMLTLTLAYPYARCFFLSWQINCIVINGRRLQFTGDWKKLYPIWILSLFLTIITCGIYFPWMYSRLRKWEWENTSFEEIN